VAARRLQHAIVMRVVLLVLALVAVTRTGYADDDPVSPAHATSLSLDFTLIGTGLLAGGIVSVAADPNPSPTIKGVDVALFFGAALATGFGPYTGHWYADAPPSWSEALGPVLRGSALGLVLLGSWTCLYSGPDDSLHISASHPCEAVVLSTSAAMWIGGAVWDVATAGNSARRHNHAHRYEPVSVAFTGQGFAVLGTF
jgi:hypothetical protein